MIKVMFNGGAAGEIETGSFWGRGKEYVWWGRHSWSGGAELPAGIDKGQDVGDGDFGLQNVGG